MNQKADIEQDVVENKNEEKKENDVQEKKKSIKLKIIRLVFFVIISLMIGTSVYKINARNLMHDQMPMVFGFSSATVLTGSMEPTLSIDDLIFVKKCDFYDVGDIIVFQERSKIFDGNACVVHRIVSVNKDGTITTKGDANDTADDPIELKSVKGKVIFSVPSVGKAVNFIKSPVVVIIVILLSALIVERSYKKEKNEEKSEIEILQEQIELLKKQKELEELKKSSEKKEFDDKEKEE